MSKELIISVVSFVVVFIRPYLDGWGLPDYLSGDVIAFVAAGIYAACSTIRWLISKAPQLAGPAMIAVSFVEETMKNQPNDIKRTTGYQKLCEMIDGMNIGMVQKWLLKQGAPMAIEAIVKQAKVLLYTKPPAKKIEAQ